MTDLLDQPPAVGPWTEPDGNIVIRRFDVDLDCARLHAWVTHERARFWGMADATEDDVREAYRAIVESAHEDAWIGEVDGAPTFLVETYDPCHHPLADHLDLCDGDLGMHLLVGPPQGAPVSGLTTRVMHATMRFCFENRGAGRVVVEPDVRNSAIHAKNHAVGFVRVRDVDLPGKQAALSVCTRAGFAQAARRPGERAWEDADRLVLAKAIGEFAHELLIAPELLGPGDPGTNRPAGGTYRVVAGETHWQFDADRYALDHWAVEARTITRTTDSGTELPVTAADFVLDFRHELALDGELLTTYLEELGSTVAHRARTTAPGRPHVAQLLRAPAHDIEAAMAEGHPCFVATNGRIGFSAEDLRRYSPESGADVRPLWVAVPADCSHFAHSCAHADEDAAYDAALGTILHRRLRTAMNERGLDPHQHRLMPVHPWQWDERLRTTFAEDVARGRITLLGEDPDTHRAAQSIRTWVNIDSPQRPYVKTALAVRNMGFVRGLSPAYMRGTPAINDYVAGIVRDDDELRRCGFDVLTEFASVGYTGDLFHRNALHGPHTRMIAALWRESPASRERASHTGEPAEERRPMTMAALLHRDPAGNALVTALIRASGLAPRVWLRRYLEAYMRPIVHLLCEHRLAFIPHGENIILLMRDHEVAGAYLKDIGEEVGLMDDGHGRALPADVERIRIHAPREDIVLGLFTDIFDGFLRFLAPMLVQDGLMSADGFWKEVAACLRAYATDHPDAAASLDLFAPRFARSCLNRLQLRNPLEMVRLDDTVGSLIKRGDLANPVAGR